MKVSETAGNSLMIRTPEGVTFSLPLAGPMLRMLALTIDFLLVIFLFFVLMRLMGPLMAAIPDFFGAVQILMFFVVKIGYAMIFEALWRGQTLGKKSLGLRVVDERGLRLRFSQVAMRNLMRPVDAFPLFYFIGGVSSFLSPRGQRLGDLVAGTVVVRLKPAVEPDIESLMSGKFNSFRKYPHLEARLRQKVSAAEAQLALSALLRREDLQPEARLSLFREMAEHLRAKVEFPEDATLGLADEQYVRNVAETVFRRRGGEV